MTLVRHGLVMRRFQLLLTTALLALACLGSASVLAAPRVGMVTMQPGLEYWSRFGHDAILIDDRADHPGSTPLLYNYGFFDFDQPGFFLHFAQGYMTYLLAAVPLDVDLQGYQQEGRGVSVQWLDFTPSQAQVLSDALAINALPEHASYRYDYFTANCSTKVRDALNAALGGLLQRQLGSPSHGLTYRSEAVRLGAPLPWLGLGMDFALSGYGDTPLSLWDEAFVPMRLRDSLRNVRTALGTPLVLSEQTLVANRLPLPPEETPNWRNRFILAGLALSLLMIAAYWKFPRTAAAVSAVFWLLCGVVGIGLGVLWGFTEHRAIWANQNILLTSPLSLLLLPGAWRMARGLPASLWQQRWVAVLAASACLALFIKCFPFLDQYNGNWIGLFLPIHLALAYAVRRQRSAVN